MARTCNYPCSLSFPFLFSPHTNRRVYAQSSSKVRVSRGSLTLGRLHRRCPPALWNNTFYYNPRAQVVDNLHKKSVMISLCWIACLNLSLPETHLNISFFFIFFPSCFFSNFSSYISFFYSYQTHLGRPCCISCQE